MNSQQQLEFREEAIALVIYNQEKRIFEINEEAQDFLKQLQGPLGIISVAGMYRTGKSYLLNRMLLNRSGGFGVGPTINPCTKGVWIWGKPIQGFTPDGDPINVLVLDTEGLGALDEDSNHDVRIFSLAILLSSYFIYNSVGSIDENALSNLSLVINLTKHIHLKSNGLQEDVDPEEYSQYFPSFMWVVRDFSLQLVDMEGESITSKEYLEKALGNQKGFSDGVEQKNRIRRLLKSFFKERDCCTMVRPLTKEENLQILEKMELEDLRSEFVEQVMQLRRKVINRIKPKMMNGKKLNGEMLYNLAFTYVDSINKGAVPNIETAWSYICKNECHKAQMDSYELFERSFSETFEIRSPVFDDELKEIYLESKKIALEEFGKVAVGEIQKQYMVELKDKMKHRYNILRQENEKTAEQRCLIFLQNNYISIEKRLKNQDYDSIYEIVEELKNFQNYFLENGPLGTNRKVIMNEFCLKALAEASEFYFKNMSNEMRLQEQITGDQMMKLQAEIKEIKEEQRTKNDYFESKLRNSETEKAELSAKEQSMKENLYQIQKERDQLEQETQEKLISMKREHQRLLDEMMVKIQQNEEGAKEMQRQSMSAESEYDKQKLLLEQKVSFYEQSLEQAQKKEQELSTELKNQRRELLSSNKEITTKFEQTIKDFNTKIQELQEVNFEWESKFQELETKYEQEKQRWEDGDSHLKTQSQKTKEQLQEITKSYEQLKRKYNEDVEQIKLVSEEELVSKKDKINDLEYKLEQIQDQFEIAKQKWEKDQAIYKQKQEFLEFQVSEERRKNDDQKQSHEQMIRNIQFKERESVIGKEEATKRINDINDKHSQEYQELEAKYESTKKRLGEQVDQLQERNSELELSLKIQVGDFEKEFVMLREQLQIAEEQRNKAQETVKSLDLQKLRLVDESELRAKNRLNDLELELEEKTQSYEETIVEMQAKSEEQLSQLKMLHETERERLERRLIEEKDRAVKRYNNMIEDYEQKLQDAQQRFEEDIQMVQDESHDKEMQMQDAINHLHHENSMRQQQIESLEKYLAETKESLNKIQNMSSSHMEQALDKFNDERKELIAKIEKLAGDLTRKERQITTLENQKETLSSQFASKEKQISEIKKESNQEKNDISDKLEALRQKNQDTLDELTQRKIEFEREKALKTQQLQFQDQKINDLSRQLEDTIKMNEERIKYDREELLREMNEKVQRITAEKEASDIKYDQKRKALKDLESVTIKQTSQMEREKAVLLEKYQNLETQQKDLMKNYESEIIKLREANDQLQMALHGDKASIQEEVEKWRREYNELERVHADINNQYDRDKALWEGKFKFLEQQKDTAKKDFDDANKKFQQTVEQLQKQQHESKAKTEQNNSMILAQLEQKYQQRIKELQENGSNTTSELTQKNKQLERENKLMFEKLELQNKSKQSEQGSLEKKLEKALDAEARLTEELEQLKTERDNKMMEYQRSIDKERENYKQKLNETVGKGTSVQAKQTELLLSFEKERAKWEHEKTYLMNQKEDAVESQQRLEKKVEMLLRENEKLKNDMRNSRKNMYQATQNTSNYQAAMVGTKILSGMGGLGGFGKATTSFGQDGGQITDRGSYQQRKQSGVDKSQVITAGGLLEMSQKPMEMKMGGGLDNSLIKNILSTPSSSSKSKSEERSETFSPEGSRK